MQDKFFFLPVKRRVDFQGGSLFPLDEFDERMEAIKAEVDTHDGHFYYHSPLPPFQLPASHMLEITDPLMGNFRDEDGAFLMQLAGYLFGYRLQFHDWWIDGRLPINRNTHAVVFHNDASGSFFSRAYACWKTWDEKSRKFFPDILYAHARAPSYYWEWEQFTFEYTVLDALFRHAVDINALTKGGFHGDRIRRLCSKYGLQQHEDIFTEIVKLRNDWQHEARWDGKRPGSDTEQRGYHLNMCLRSINQRLIAAMLDFEGEYTASDWRIWVATHVFE